MIRVYAQQDCLILLSHAYIKLPAPLLLLRCKHLCSYTTEIQVKTNPSTQLESSQANSLVQLGMLLWWAGRGVVLLSAPVLICVLKMQEKWSLRKSFSMQLRPLPPPLQVPVTQLTSQRAARSSLAENMLIFFRLRSPHSLKRGQINATGSC